MKNKAKKLVNAFAIVFFLVPIFASASTVTDGVRSCIINPDSGDADATLTDSSGTGFTGSYSCEIYLPDDNPVGEILGNFWSGQPISSFIGPRNSGNTPAGTYHAVIFDSGSFDCNSLNYAACSAIGTANGDFFVVTPSPPPPPPVNSLRTIIGNSTSSMAAAAGFTNDDAASWMWETLALPFLGSGLGVLLTLRWYIMVLIILLIVIFFGFRYFGFFKH